MATPDERRAEAREEARYGAAHGCIGCATGIMHDRCTDDEPDAAADAPCDGCNVRYPWEHRCYGDGCPCEECAEPVWTDGRLIHPARPGICLHHVGTTPGMWCSACRDLAP